MIFSIPEIYKDEILYSFICRYHERSGNISIKYTLQDFFSKHDVNLNLYLPCHISTMVENFPIGCTYTGKYIVLNHTLYKFYTFFSSDEYTKQLMDYMLDNSKNKVKAVHYNDNKKPMYFKFCPKCLDEDIKKYGETYWHRLHQIEGMYFCVKHKIPLENSRITCSNYSKKEYTVATKDNCIVETKKEYSYELKNKLLRLAENIEFIMYEDLPNRSTDWYQSNYINILKEKGLVTINGNLNINEIIYEFKKYYGDEFLNIVNCNIDQDRTTNWLINILRKSPQQFHPIKHLLIIDFLGYSIKDIFKNKIRYNPFGKGPWPCLNSVCQHYKENVIISVDKVTQAYSKKQNYIIGTFKCEICGFEYYRRGPDESEEDIYTISKVKNYGPVWKLKLKELINNNTPKQKMKKILNADIATILKYKNELELNINNIDKISTNYTKKIDRRKSNKNYHKIWIDLVDNNPGKSKTELSKLNKSVYDWLLKNDREWLDKNSPSKRIPIKKNDIIDWKKRDDEILEMIKKSFKVDLNSNEKPKKITLNYISILINRPLGSYISSGKMPKVEKYINLITDSRESFIKKKIIWAINLYYNNEKEMPSPYYIMQFLGINTYLKAEKDVYEKYTIKLINTILKLKKNYKRN